MTSACWEAGAVTPTFSNFHMRWKILMPLISQTASRKNNSIGKRLMHPPMQNTNLTTTGATKPEQNMLPSCTCPIQAQLTRSVTDTSWYASQETLYSHIIILPNLRRPSKLHTLFRSSNPVFLHLPQPTLPLCCCYASTPDYPGSACYLKFFFSHYILPLNLNRTISIYLAIFLSEISGRPTQRDFKLPHLDSRASARSFPYSL